MRTSDEKIYDGTVTEDGNSYSTPINVKGAAEVVLFLDITAVSGTDPTLAISFMTQDTIINKWFPIGKFDLKTGITSDTTYVINGIGSFIACKWELTGNTPSFTFSLNASIKD